MHRLARVAIALLVLNAVLFGNCLQCVSVLPMADQRAAEHACCPKQEEKVKPTSCHHSPASSQDQEERQQEGGCGTHSSEFEYAKIAGQQDSAAPPETSTGPLSFASPPFDTACALGSRQLPTHSPLSFLPLRI
jgi:hypothetical protein